MSTLIKKHSFFAFVLLAIGITWIGSTMYALALPLNGSVLPSFLGAPGGLIWYYGPCLAAIVITRIGDGKEATMQLLRRLLDWRVHWRWYAFIVIYPLGLHLAIVYLDQLLGGSRPVYFQAEGVPTGNVWLVLFGLIVFQVLVRGIGEEVGWRGFALPHLQARLGALPASLILGVIWGLWHFHPANFPGLISLGGLAIFINILLTTFIFTWLFNHTRGSAFMAAMFHMTLNVAEYVIPISAVQASPTRQLLQIALVGIVVIGLVLFSGPHLGHKTRRP